MLDAAPATLPAPPVADHPARVLSAASRHVPLTAAVSLLVHLVLAGLLLTAVRLPDALPILPDETVEMVFDTTPAGLPTPEAEVQASPAEPPIPTPQAELPTPPPVPAPQAPPPDAEPAPEPPSPALPEPPTPSSMPVFEAPLPQTQPPPTPEPPAPPAPVLAPPPSVPATPQPPSHPAPRPAPPRPPPPRPALRRSPAEDAPPPASAAPLARTPAPAVPPASSPAAPVPTAPVPTAEVSPAWRGALGAWLQAHKTYPAAARAAGQEGRVAVRFTVDRTGRVLQALVASGSGSPVLDEAARSLLAGAQLPPFPPAMTQASLTMTVAIRYAGEQ